MYYCLKKNIIPLLSVQQILIFMQIFEFQFNPKKKDVRVDTLSYEPEKSNRSLYLVGEMKGIVPGNEKLLGKIMKMIKDEYASRLSKTFEEAFKESLVKVNEYLAIEIAKDNVSWVGNLHLAALSVSGNKVDIAKIGKVSVFLIDYEKMVELDGKIKKGSLENGDFKPKVFGTVTSGKLGKGERIAVLTEEPLKVFNKAGLLKKISELPFLDKKIVEGIVDDLKKDISKISGSFFLLDTKGSPKEKKPFLSENEVDFSLKEIIHPLKNIIRKRIGKKKKKKTPIIKLPEIKMKKEYKKGLVLLFLMMILLISGSIIFRNNEKKNIEELTMKMEEMEETIFNVDLLISSGKEKEAFSILTDLYNEALRLKFDKIEADTVLRLESLSKIQFVDSLESLVSFDTKELTPERILVINNTIYLYTPFSDKIMEIDISTQEKRFYTAPARPGSATVINNLPVFFAKPDLLFTIQNSETIELDRLKLPSFTSDLGGIISFGNNIYLRGFDNREIVRYVDFGSEPERWFNSETKKPANIQSMSADGSIWLISSGNLISKYVSGNHVEDIEIDIFPFIKNLSRISTSSNNPYLFLLEPTRNRFIIIDKRGGLVKQFQGESLNGLVDFWISNDGKEIFLLNRSEIYQLTI